MNNSWFTIPDGTFLVATEMSIVIAVLLVAYSVATAGKRGSGWLVISVLLGVLAVLARLALSMFTEATNSSYPPDWDEE